MPTKAEAKERKAAWQLALSEGRVVRADNGMTLTSFPTRQEAEKRVANMRAVNLYAEIVQYPPQS